MTAGRVRALGVIFEWQLYRGARFTPKMRSAFDRLDFNDLAQSRQSPRGRSGTTCSGPHFGVPAVASRKKTTGCPMYNAQDDKSMLYATV